MSGTGRDDAPLLAVNARDPEELRLALVRDGRLHDLRWTRRERGSMVGNLMLGVVARVEPGLDAAFVDLGTGRAGFLHRDQVHPAAADPDLDPVALAERSAPRPGAEGEEEPTDETEPPLLSGGGEIAALLRPGRRLLVQVLRDPLRQKGATLTTFVSLAGHRIVWMPCLGRAAVSRRVADTEERERLRGLLAPLSGEGRGMIARTAAEGAAEPELRAEAEDLAERWRGVAARARHRQQPGAILEEEPASVRAARDLLAADVRRVVVDDASVEDELRAAFAPGPGGVEFERHALLRPLFETLDLEREWQSLFRPRVPLPGGGSLVIHETEALTAVDVNSGPTASDSLEQTALEANLAACEEIARQARLRDLGGIVVVDFIDMRLADHRRRVESRLRAALAADRARQKIGHLGSFGLMAFTRRRVGGGLPRAIESLCRGCGGSGHVAHHHAGGLRALRRMRAEPAAKGFRIRAQPGTCAVLRGPLAAAVAALGRPVELAEDLQVSAADPVVQAELLAGPGGGG